jgi:predicted DNA-binding protein (UPF0251 family)
MLLGDYHALLELRYAGDTAASDIVLDLTTAIERAGLTDRQREVLRLVYEADMAQVDVGNLLGVSKQTVNRMVNIATTKIARIYEYWARHGEGYSITTEEVQDE